MDSAFFWFILEVLFWVVLNIIIFTPLLLFYTNKLDGVIGIKNNILTEDQRKPMGDDNKVPSDKTAILSPPVATKAELDSIKPDVILIGGGTSALVAASLMSRHGYKVLLFEQHTKLGGGCHTFKKGRFEFDTGLHYVGDMKGDENFCQLLDQLTEGQITWYPMDERFDKIEIGNPDDEKLFKTIDIYAGYEKWKQKLNEQFPGNEKVFDKLQEIMTGAKDAAFAFGFMKVAPEFVVKRMSKLPMAKSLSSWLYYFRKTSKEVLYEISDNPEVLACVEYIYGTLALPSKYLSLFLNITVADHYVKSGGFYPKHGPSIIPYHLVKGILKYGGKCCVRSNVDSFILDRTPSGKLVCKGVNVLIAGKEAISVNAKIVISSAGFYNTFVKMMPPKEIVPKICPNIDRICQTMQPSLGGFSLFVGLSATSEELGLSAYNSWMFDSLNFEELYETWIGEKDPWNAVDNLSLPFVYVSFPSAKDRSFGANQEKPTSTCTVITLCPYSWFEMWNDKPTTKRGDQYMSLKEAVGQKIWQRVLKSFPQLEEKVEVFEMGTPVTSNFYLNANNGEIYGMRHGMNRYSEEFSRIGRFKSEIGGLYVTGQDTWCCGFVPAIVTGALACTTITKRNYLDDIDSLYKKLKL